MYVTQYVDNTRYGQSSVADYAGYLEKESLVQAQLDGPTSRRFSAYLDKQNDVVRVEGREYFFNGTGDTYDTEDVVKRIDANVRGLKRSEARYYTFSISPSSEEIAHLRRTIADTKQTLIELGEEVPPLLEDTMMRTYLKDYAIRCMDAYARNFGHPEIRDNRDLLWFGMVEKDRYWKRHDPEVRTNIRIDRQIAQLERQLGKGRDRSVRHQIAALEKEYVRESRVRAGGSDEILRPMMAKAGENWHIHVTVSRRDITNSISLSPNANGRGSAKHVLNGRAVRVGFDREAYKIACEQIFDRLFSHQRLQTESYERAKELRKTSLVAYERQLQRDRAVRRAEIAEFRKLKYGGYGAYYESLLQAERLDARQMMWLKGQFVRQIRRLEPRLNGDNLMNYSIEELQQEFNRLAQERNISFADWGQNLGVGLGDRVVETSGLRGYHPVRTSYKILRKGIAMRRAVDRRREVYEQWMEIYSDAWHRDNYLFDSIAVRRSADVFLSQAEYLARELNGRSVILENAGEWLAAAEGQLVDDFLQQCWPDRISGILTVHAREIFGTDGEAVRSMKDFEHMAAERLFPVDARRCVAEAAARCQPPLTVAALELEISRCPAERAAVLKSQLDVFRSERRMVLEHLRGVLQDQTLGLHPKEDALLRLALEDRDLNRALRDFRPRVLKILEQQYPDTHDRQLRNRLQELLKGLQELRMERQKDFSEAIDLFIREELPGYSPIVERQSQLEQLIRETVPDPEKCAERILDMNNELANRLFPHAQRYFEQHAQRLFGPEVHLKNEHDFLAYVEKTVSPERIQAYKDSLVQVFARIEEKRRELVGVYVNQLPQKVVTRLRHQQSYLNRYIDRHFSAAEAKRKKEVLQQRIAATCRRSAIPTPEYKIYGIAARQEVSAQAMAKAGKVKMIYPVTPQQVVVKVAFKLMNVLTKGY